jgi:hypothetical protein
MKHMPLNQSPIREEIESTHGKSLPFAVFAGNFYFQSQFSFFFASKFLKSGRQMK